MSVRETDNVHLDFLLGSVRRNSSRNSKKSLKYKASQSLSPSLEGTLDRCATKATSPLARQRWLYAQQTLSKGYFPKEFSIFDQSGFTIFYFCWRLWDKAENWVELQSCQRRYWCLRNFFNGFSGFSWKFLFPSVFKNKTLENTENKTWRNDWEINRWRLQWAMEEEEKRGSVGSSR